MNTSGPTGAPAPATPLIVHDPFVSVWSMTDELTQSWPHHWSGLNQSMCGMVHIDGRPYRFMGLVSRMGEPVPAMRQTGRVVTPTHTIYSFEAAGVALQLTFLTPCFPEDLDLMARPVSYVEISIAAQDGAPHAVSAYVDFSANWVAGTAETEVVWGRHRSGPVVAMFMGRADQTPLARSGDEVQIDWGYLYTSPEPGSAAVGASGDGLTLRDSFAAAGTIPESDDVQTGRAAGMPHRGHRGPSGAEQDRPGYMVSAWSKFFGTVSGSATWRLAVAYDHVFQITYFERRLRPYWRRHGGSMIGLLATAWAERETLAERARAYDEKLIEQLVASGGDTYARLGILAFRQCVGGHALVEDTDGKLLYFSKENSSNGCLGTVDLTYPSAPFFLLFNPALLEAQMRPICAYAASGRWPFPYAPHDVGQFPNANGQVYGGGELSEHNQMPYEECGNMLILAAALFRATGDDRFVRAFWPQFSAWADYLATHGIDPENQLCTDDFAGHLPHNANLSLKAIIGLGAYGQLCSVLGEDQAARRYGDIAKDWAARWPALANDGDAFRLAFDQPRSWSQKYNLIWDRLLGLGLFPPEIADTEVAFYRLHQDRFGLPLDSRSHYTKLDWLVWTACLTARRADFDALLAPVAAWLDARAERVPLSDWFDTESGQQIGRGGFRARPVVGGVYIKLLADLTARRGLP